LLGLLLVIAVFQIGSGGLFLSPLVLGNIVTVAAALAIIGTGVTLLIISGEFDLSVGTMFAFAPVILGLLWTVYDVPAPIAFGVAMLGAVAVGALNGLLVLRLKLPSFIATLGTFYALGGISLVLTKGVSIQMPASLMSEALGGKVLGSIVTMPVIWAGIVVVFFTFVLGKTRFGNWVFATGGKRGVARAMGVPDTRVRYSLFILSSILAAFAGCIVFARLTTVTGTTGFDYNLLAIVAAVVGGTSLYGATGTVLGTVIGAVLVSSIQPGLLVIGAGGTWYQAVIGTVLVVAVLFNIRFERFRASRIGLHR
jgi:simple sugar transport system permease protein